MGDVATFRNAGSQGATETTRVDGPIGVEDLESKPSTTGQAGQVVAEPGSEAGKLLLLDDLDREPGSLLNASRWQVITKRALDIVGALAGLVILSPVFLTVSAMILLHSGRPIFFVQTRAGKDGRPFKFVKFRTMKRNAEAERHLVIDLNEADGPIFKIKNDPRITPVGKILRKYSLDELPQLHHVLMGHMSLVGPRPPLESEVASYTRWERQRLRVKPGLTCKWQVSGRSDLGFRSWVELDIEYIRDWNLRTDLKLLLQTLPAVVSARGAY